jgi:LysR family hydrogen peroxide-inducible transcriptional activator
MLPEIHRRYPALKLHIREELGPNLLTHLEAGDLDLILTATPTAGTDIETATLFDEPLLLIAPREHPYAGRRIIQRRDLAGQSLLTLERGHQLYKDVQTLCSETGAVLLTEYEGTSLDTLRQMVGMGLGLAFLPALYVQMEVPNDRQVVVCRLGDQSPKRTVVMAWRRHSPQRPHYLKIAKLTRRIVSKNAPHIEPFPDRSGESSSAPGA